MNDDYFYNLHELDLQAAIAELISSGLMSIEDYICESIICPVCGYEMAGDHCIVCDNDGEEIGD